ncbi:MAG: hypothetical protein J6Z36_02805, partial [Clostridia bacterium]|nr:hypothetical protein [Clostridia bacterium]
RVLGVSDMTAVFDGEKYNCGLGLRVYDTSAGKIGVLVGQDVFFPESVKSLAQCGSDMIVCAYEHVGENVEQILLRAAAFCYGVPMCMSSHGYAQVADVSGKLHFASPQPVSYCTLDNMREYHLIETRRRGFYKPQGNY